MATFDWGKKGSTQLELPLSWSTGSRRGAVAWIVSLPSDKIEVAARWLSSSRRFGPAPFFVDATRGVAVVNSADLVVMIDPLTESTRVCLPCSLQVSDQYALLNDVVRTGKPVGVFGGTPHIHDMLLIKGLGGPLKNGPSPEFRSMLDLALDRLSSKSFRSNIDAVGKICANAVNRWRLPEEMARLVQQMWAKTIVAAHAQRMQGRWFEFADTFADEVSVLRLNDLHYVASQVEFLARRYIDGGQDQLSLFEPVSEVSPPPGESGLLHLRCAAIAVSYASQSMQPAMSGPNSIVRDDVVFSGRRIPSARLRSWLRAASSLSLHPQAIVETNGETTVIKVRLVPDFLRGLYGDFAEQWAGRRADGVYEILPHLGDRIFSPGGAQVRLGETATFSTKSVPRKQRRRVSLTLLTPSNRTVSVALPHAI